MDAGQINADLAKLRGLGGRRYSTLAGHDIAHVFPDWIRTRSARADLRGADPRPLEGMASALAGRSSDILDPSRDLDDQLEGGVGPRRSVGEEIAARVMREQKEEAVAFLENCGLDHEVAELAAVEGRLHSGSDRDLRHAAFSARNLLEAIADRLFPASGEPWVDRGGVAREVGPENVANRLSAYVDQRLTDRIEAAERRAFQGLLDATARWVGSGPHGIHTAAGAEVAYTRLMGILSFLARAHREA